MTYYYILILFLTTIKSIIIMNPNVFKSTKLIILKRRTKAHKVVLIKENQTVHSRLTSSKVDKGGGKEERDVKNP